MAGMARKAQRSADLRIGTADREAAIATLTGALRDGRLDLAETMAALSLPDRTILVVANYLGVAVHTLS
jgi:hypothetical protein